jgi:hypothetical protein
LEWLLSRAESLANVLTVSDPRGRLLQVALLRRDHTLLAAIVDAIDLGLPVRLRSTSTRAGKRPSSMRAGFAGGRRRPEAERPTVRPKRAR